MAGDIVAKHSPRRNRQERLPEFRAEPNAPFSDNLAEISEENKKLRQELNSLKINAKGKEELSYYLSMENQNLQEKLNQSITALKATEKESKKIKSLYHETLSLLKLSGVQETKDLRFRHCHSQTTSNELGTVEYVYSHHQMDKQISELNRSLMEKVANEKKLIEQNQLLKAELKDTIDLIDKFKNL